MENEEDICENCGSTIIIYEDLWRFDSVVLCKFCVHIFRNNSTGRNIVMEPSPLSAREAI